MINVQVYDGKSLEAYNEVLIEYLSFYCDVLLDKDDIESVRTIFPRQLIFRECQGYLDFLEQLMTLIKDSEVHTLTNLQSFVLYHILMQVEEAIHESLDLVTERFLKNRDEDVEKLHLDLIEDIGYLLNNSFFNWDFLIQTDFSNDGTQESDIQAK